MAYDWEDFGAEDQGVAVAADDYTLPAQAKDEDEAERKRKRDEAEAEMRRAEYEAALRAIDVARNTNTPLNFQSKSITLQGPAREAESERGMNAVRLMANPNVIGTRPGIPSPMDRDYEIYVAAENARQKFEAQNAYLDMVKSGMQPTDALAKSGMSLFLGQTAKPMNPYQQAQMDAEKERIRIADEANQLRGMPKAQVMPPNRIEEELGPLPGLPPTPAKPATSGVPLMGWAGLGPKPAQPAFEGTQGRLGGKRITYVPSEGQPQRVAPPIAAPTEAQPSKSENEVVKRLKNGRLAVFNSDTKQFIRYAP